MRALESRTSELDGWTITAAAGVDAAALGRRMIDLFPRVFEARDSEALAAAVPGAEVQRWRPWRTAFLHRGPDGLLHVKVYRPKGVIERVVAALAPTRAATSWTMGEALRDAGVPTPAPLLLASRPSTGAVLVTRPLESPVLLTDELKRLKAGNLAPRALLREVARLAAAFHAAGFLHGDFTASNVLLHGPAASRSLTLIDLDRTKRLPILPPLATLWLQSLDLRLLLLTTWGEVSRRDWMRLLSAYGRARNLSRPLRKRLAGRVLSAKRGRVRLGASTGTIGGREPWGS